MLDDAAIRNRVSRHLPEGETYVSAFQAVGGIHPRLAHIFRVIAVTDTTVHLYSARWLRACDPKKLLASLPPGEVVPVRGVGLGIYDEIHIAGTRLWVPLSFHDQLVAAMLTGRFVRVS